MEGVSLLDTIFDDDIDYAEDVEMIDVEEGELIEQGSTKEVPGSCDVGDKVNQESNKKNPRNRKKRKNKKKRGNNSSPNVTNINKFVLDVCKSLRERKSYLVWTAVGCLGVSALSDLVKEVDAIQTCGGQKTADGNRYRNGGGILWNIIKQRDPNAYKEIMKKGREFEKQFKQPVHDSKQEPEEQPNSLSQQIDQAKCDQTDSVSIELPSNSQSHLQPPAADQKRRPVHDRIRQQVTYDDLLGDEDTKDESTPPK